MIGIVAIIGVATCKCISVAIASVKPDWWYQWGYRLYYWCGYSECYKYTISWPAQTVLSPVYTLPLGQPALCWTHFVHYPVHHPWPASTILKQCCILPSGQPTLCWAGSVYYPWPSHTTLSPFETVPPGQPTWHWPCFTHHVLASAHHTEPIWDYVLWPTHTMLYISPGLHCIYYLFTLWPAWTMLNTFYFTPFWPTSTILKIWSIQC